MGTPESTVHSHNPPTEKRGSTKGNNNTVHDKAQGRASSADLGAITIISLHFPRGDGSVFNSPLKTLKNCCKFPVKIMVFIVLLPECYLGPKMLHNIRYLFKSENSVKYLLLWFYGCCKYFYLTEFTGAFLPLIILLR